MTQAAVGPRVGWKAPTDFRRLMGRMPTGVAVVTALGRPSRKWDARGETTLDTNLERHGMTVDSLTCASYDPPMVSFFADRSSATGRAVLASGRFGANVLGRGAEQTCYRFASPGPDKFADEAVDDDARLPRVPGAVIWLECALESTIEAGDHTGFLGRVVSAEAPLPATSPLVYCRSRLGALKAGSARHLPTETLTWWNE